jgi:hypothetical protein
LALPSGGSFTASSTDTLSNKTLTAPKLVDGGYIADANGNELLIGDTVTSAVNEVTLANAATGANPKLSATGGDTNIGLDLQAKGTGTYNLLGSATAPAEQRLYEDTDNGTNYVGLKAPASVASSITFTMPATTGAGKVMTDVAGDGVFSMETPSAGSATFCGCQASKSSSQALYGATYTDVTFNVDDVDTDSIHDAGGASAEFTIPTGKGGEWEILVSAATLSTASGTFRIKLKKNGSDLYENYFRQGEAAYYVHGLAWTLTAAATDVFKIQVYDNSSATLLSTADVSGMSFRLSIKRLGD